MAFTLNDSLCVLELNRQIDEGYKKIDIAERQLQQ